AAPSAAPPVRLGPSRSPDRALIQRKCAGCGGGAPCAGCDEEEGARLSRSPEPVGAALPAGSGVPLAVRSVLGTSGKALAPTVRAGMESHFGHDFSHVRVHAD